MVKLTSGYGTDPLHTVEDTAKILKLCTKETRINNRVNQ
jgi:hypothetical protein